MFIEKTFTGGEVPLNYAEGPSNGPPLVMLHGLTSGWKIFQPLLPYFVEDYSLYLPDLRGHGRSGRADTGYCVDDYARDIAAFLAERFSQPVSLLGHSLGALAALFAAARVPQQVNALVLLDPPLFLRNAPGAAGWFAFVRETLRSAPDEEQVLANCRKRGDRSEADCRARAAFIANLDPRAVDWDRLDGVFLREAGLAAALHATRCPTLLMRGEWQYGGQIREQDAAYFKSQVPHAWEIQIPHGSHAFPWEQVNETAEHTRTFLRAYASSKNAETRR